MANDMDPMLFRFHPSVPHYFMCVEIFFDDAQSIYLPAAPVILFTTVMRIRFRKNNINAASTYALAGSRTLSPEFIPAFYILHCMAFHIAIIRGGILPIVQRT